MGCKRGGGGIYPFADLIYHFADPGNTYGTLKGVQDCNFRVCIGCSDYCVIACAVACLVVYNNAGLSGPR